MGSCGLSLSLLETVTQSKHCVEDVLNLHRRNLDKVSQLNSQIERLEQENKALRAALSHEPHDAIDNRNLILENSRLRVLVAEEQGEKLKWMEKYDALLGFLRKSHNDVATARDSLQALQSTEPHRGNRPPKGGERSDSGPSDHTEDEHHSRGFSYGSISSGTDISQHVKTPSDDCIIKGDQRQRLVPIVKTGRGPMVSRGEACTSLCNAGQAHRSFSSLQTGNLLNLSESTHHEGDCYPDTEPMNTYSARVRPAQLQDSRQYADSSQPSTSAWHTQSSNSQHPQEGERLQAGTYGRQGEGGNAHRRLLYACSNSSYDDEDESLPYYCVQPALPSWKAANHGHIHPPQVLLVHVSPGDREQVIDAEVYEGDVTTSDEDSGTEAPPRRESFVPSPASSIATLSQVDSEELHNCTVSLVDDLLRDLRNSINSHADWHDSRVDSPGADLAEYISIRHDKHTRRALSG